EPDGPSMLTKLPAMISSERSAKACIGVPSSTRKDLLTCCTCTAIGTISPIDFMLLIPTKRAPEDTGPRRSEALAKYRFLRRHYPDQVQAVNDGSLIVFSACIRRLPRSFCVS